MKFEINRPYLITALLVSVCALGLCAYIVTAQVYADWIAQRPYRGGMNWGAAALIDVACALAFLAMIWKTYCDANTQFGPTALVQPGLFGSREIKWAEVTEVSVHDGFGYALRTKSEKITISPFAYRRPHEVVETLGRHLEGVIAISARQRKSQTSLE